MGPILGFVIAHPLVVLLVAAAAVVEWFRYKANKAEGERAKLAAAIATKDATAKAEEAQNEAKNAEDAYAAVRNQYLNEHPGERK